MKEAHCLQVSISCWRLESISIYVQKTPVECFEYAVATRRRPLRYHNYINAVFHMLMHYLLFHQNDHPSIQTASTVQLQNCQSSNEHRVTRTSILSVILCWKRGNLSNLLPLYREHFNEVFPMLMHCLLFH